MNRLPIWHVVSYAWTEIGLSDEEYPKYANEIFSECQDWQTVNKVIIRDILASFAVESFLIIPCMLWMIMPDWGFDLDYLRKRMEQWYLKPYWRHFLNPIRLLGYPVALMLTADVRRKLKKAYMVNLC